MFKLLSILVLVTLPKELMMKSNEPGTSSSSGPEFSILPLILIRTQDKSEFIHPTDISVQSMEKGNFIFGTKFSAKKRGEQFLFCGPEPKDNDNSDDQYCSYELSEPQQGSQVLTCAHEPKPFVQKLTEKNSLNDEVEIPCKSITNKQGKMFAFVYEVKSNDDQKKEIFEIYRFCFREETQTVLFTEHITAAPRLLASQLFERERKQTYEMSDEAYGFSSQISQKIKEKFKQLKDQNTVGNKRKRELTDSGFFMSDQKLVPSEDMAFALWRKPTFHYLNVRKMKEDKIKLWDHISNLIQEDAIKKSVEYHILTGAFHLTGSDKDKNELIQSPDLWIKVVHYKGQNDHNEEYNQSLAIIMNHNPESPFVIRSLQYLCEKDLCKDKFTKKFPIVGKSVCCTGSVEKVKFYFEINGLKFHEHSRLTINTFDQSEVGK